MLQEATVKDDVWDVHDGLSAFLSSSLSPLLSFFCLQHDWAYTIMNTVPGLGQLIVAWKKQNCKPFQYNGISCASSWVQVIGGESKMIFLIMGMEVQR